MSESVGVVLSVASRHPAARSSSGSNSEWPQLHQRLPVELPPLPLPEAPTLGKVPVYSVVRNPPTVELYRIVVVVVILRREEPDAARVRPEARQRHLRKMLTIIVINIAL